MFGPRRLVNPVQPSLLYRYLRPLPFHILPVIYALLLHLFHLLP